MGKKSISEKLYHKRPTWDIFFREREIDGFFTMTKEGKKLKNVAN